MSSASKYTDRRTLKSREEKQELESADWICGHTEPQYQVSTQQCQRVCEKGEEHHTY